MKKTTLKIGNTTFRIGDKIELKTLFARPTKFSCDITYSMLKLIKNRKILTIAEFIPSPFGESNCHVCVKEDNGVWRWDLRHFQKVKDKSPVVNGIERIQRELNTIKMLQEIEDKMVISTSDNGKTTVSYRGEVGISKVNPEEDKYDAKIGILLATARALGFEEDIVQGFVDVIYQDFEIDWKDVSTKEIIEELQNRTK